MATLRAWQISLRNLLVMVLVVAIGAAWYGIRARSHRVQEHLIESIAAKGGYVWLDIAGPFIDIEFRPSLDRGCGQVRCLASPGGMPSAFGDDDLALVRQLDNLRSVDFTNTGVSQRAIADFRRHYPRCQIIPEL